MNNCTAPILDPRPNRHSSRLRRGLLCLATLGVLASGACSTAIPGQPQRDAFLDPQPAAGPTADPPPSVDPCPADSCSADAGPAAGEIADGISVEDTDAPALARLDSALLAALRAAATDALASGVHMYVTSGWRSAAFQQRLFDEAVLTYGSASEASKWVHSPKLSKHVSGHAIDIGPADADYWLIAHGNDYGLCQTYSNEIWHFELATAPGGSCPLPLNDPSEERAVG